jgi:hypothetical protein
MKPLVLALALVQTAAPVRTTPRTSPLDGTPWAFASGALSDPLPGAPEQAARAFAAAHPRELGLIPGAQLVEPRVFGTRWGDTVVFSQALRGLPVLHAQVAVTLDGQHRVSRVSSGSKSQAVTSGVVKVSEQEAIDAAERQVPGALLNPQGRAQGAHRLAWLQAQDGLRLVYEVYIPAFSVLRNDVLGVDAATGAVLAHENRVFTANQTQVWGTYPLPDGGGLVQLPMPDVDAGFGEDGGFIGGARAYASNCCPNEGCVAGAPSKRATGTIQGLVQYNVAICDRLPEANNLATGDWIYPPIDPPPSGTTAITATTADGSESDAFAEGEAYVHVLQQYDFFEELSGGGAHAFKFKDNQAGNRFLVWTNLMIPNVDLTQLSFSIHSDELAFVDNAAFIAKEQWQAQAILSLIYPLDSSAMVFFQGQNVDFSYDTSVTYHEFTHGMVYTVADFSGVVLYANKHGANDEQGAMNEGLADFFASAHLQDPKVGAWVGPRLNGASQDIALRDVGGSDHCPDVLWGEVHQDSQHFSQALWQARGQFQGADLGRTFDAAVYAAVVGIQAPTFDTMTEAICRSVETAFASRATAYADCEAVFTGRGVIGCDDVLAGTGSISRPLFSVMAKGDLGTGAQTYAPGPVQFKLHVAAGTRQVSIGGQVGVDPLAAFTGGGNPDPYVLVKVGGPIEFTRGASGLSDNADASKQLTLSAISGTTQAQAVSGNLDIPAPPTACAEQDVYVAIVNKGTAAASITALTVRGIGTTPSCNPSSASSTGSSGGSSGTVSSGTSGSTGVTSATGSGSTTGGAGTTGTTGAASTSGSASGSTGSTGTTSGGGCSSSAGAPWLAFLGLGLLRRRRVAS